MRTTHRPNDPASTNASTGTTHDTGTRQDAGTSHEPDTTTHAAAAPARGRGGSILASRPLMGWRTVDLLTIAFLGVAFGIAYWGYDAFYNGPISLLKIGFLPAWGLFAGPWFMAGVVGGLVVRRPGAAFLCEVVAAVVSMVPGNAYGATTLVSGILQGIGAEVAFALLGYGMYGIIAAVLAGALSAPLEAAYEWTTWTKDWPWDSKLLYLGAMVLSGAVIAGGVGWLLTRALARTGALSSFPPGFELRDSRSA